MSIRSKLILGFAVVMALVLGQGLLLFWFGARVKNDLVQIESSALAEADAAEGMLRTLTELDQLVETDLSHGHRAAGVNFPLNVADFFSRCRKHLGQGMKASLRGLALIEEDEPGEGEHELVEMDLLTKFEGTLGALESTWRRLEATGSADEADAARNELHALGQQLTQLATRYRENSLGEVKEETRQAAAKARWASRCLLLSSCLAGLAAGAASLLLARVFLKPLREFVKTAGEIGLGNRRLRLNTGRKDEFGMMARAFNQMLDAWQAATISREELEQTIHRRTRELSEAAVQIRDLNQVLAQSVEVRTAQLNESERRHRTLLDNLQGMAFRCCNERERTMELVSDGCLALLAIEPEALLGGSVSYADLIHPDDTLASWERIQSAVSRGLAFALQYRVRRSDGSWRWVWEQGHPIFDEQGTVTALEGYIADVTERVEAEQARQRLEDQLREAQKMEAIGTLAGGIAHDFNNVLGVILGNAELAQLALQSKSRLQDCLQQILIATHRAKDLVKQILTFSRPREGDRTSVRLQSLVQECVHLLRATIPAMVEIRWQISDLCSPVLADPTQIHQVMMNICTNAWHALPKSGGHIDIVLAEEELSEAAAWTPQLPSGKYVRLSITDNGHGMNASTMERIFEPFFTTKPAGEGTGLGLAVVHGIVKSHGGAIAVQSSPGKGSAFHIYLPAQGSVDVEGVQTVAPVVRGSGERIMVVDDEAAIGKVTEQYLVHLGYEVTRHTKPEAALEEFRLASTRFDLIITDQAMPGTPGLELAAALRGIRPTIPVVLASGYLDPTVQAAARRNGVTELLHKPLTMEMLGQAVARALGSEAAEGRLGVQR